MNVPVCQKTDRADLARAIRRFHQLRALAFFGGYWEDCRFAPCRKWKKCKGGPRGTLINNANPVCYENNPLPDLPASVRP